MSRVLACVVTGYGINADEELALAFRMAGAEARRVHAGDLVADPRLLGGFDILALPGGFSFGDHLGSGKVLAHLFRRSLRPALEEFVASGGLVIGVCNGFQVLVKMGLLPNLSCRWEPEVSLVHNESGVFEDRWVRVVFDPASPCVWTRGLAAMDVPVRHGEGRFVVADDRLRAELAAGHLAAVRYAPARRGRGSCPVSRQPQRLDGRHRGHHGPHGQDLRPDAAPRGVPLPGEPPRVDPRPWRAAGRPRGPAAGPGRRRARDLPEGRAGRDRVATRSPLTRSDPFPMMMSVPWRGARGDVWGRSSVG